MATLWRFVCEEIDYDPRKNLEAERHNATLLNESVDASRALNRSMAASRALNRTMGVEALANESVVAGDPFSSHSLAQRLLTRSLSSTVHSAFGTAANQ